MGEEKISESYSLSLKKFDNCVVPTRKGKGKEESLKKAKENFDPHSHV